MGFLYVLLVTSWGQKCLQYSDHPNLTTKTQGANSDNWQDLIPHRSGAISFAHLLKHPSAVETDPSPNLASSCRRTADQGPGIRKTTKRILHKRSNAALKCLALDTTFESVANFVGRSAQAREDISVKGLRQLQSPLSSNSGNDSKNNRLSHFVHEYSPEEENSNSQLTSKTPQWERLGDYIDEMKLENYQKCLTNLKGASLVLHKENRDEWKAQEAYRADEEDMKAFFEQMTPNFKLRALFELYNFLIDRSLSDQEIWWSQEDYIELQKKCEYQSDDVHLTIRIGDLILPHLSKIETELSAEEMDQVRTQFFELFKTFKQPEKSYDKKWTTGAGRKWLSERFSKISNDETRYPNLMKYLGAESEPHEWKKSLEKLVPNLDAKGWAPSSMKFNWLEHGFEEDEMEELICMVEAYKTSNVKAAYSYAQASQTAEEKNLSLLPLAYSDKNMMKRFLELNRSLSNQSKKRMLMLKWISENLYTHDQIDVSILNLGKYTANTGYDRLD
ncbi:hypothetical protein PtA15_18A106 [Puccinia triticina]|uniref:Uncharacterized protein n=1 Tax=Puccinia triticina TaxID=208348 RepID=A0ABY7DAK4_9BASI|nr:uncharacterized protein PtA15_18A106 [Puccinia triticina]WAQ93050.1 hypothetical protein PtA15_18A106 [Puccinia triticina]